MALDTPLRFTRPGRGGVLATGYEATILPDICSAILDARKKEKKLTAAELAVADQCEILTRAFAKVGIIALIDEVTGYQEIRDREALQQILDKFLRKEYAAWAQRFPEEFYREMFRLRNWQWRGMRVNRPSVVAHYTKDLVYQRLAPGILEELERRNPQGERGWRSISTTSGSPKRSASGSGTAPLCHHRIYAGLDYMGSVLSHDAAGIP